MKRAGIRCKATSFFEQFQRPKMNLFVAAHRFFHRFTIPRETRWIQNDQFVFLAFLLQKAQVAEHVFDDPFDVLQLVQLGIVLSGSDCRLADINRIDRSCSCLRRVKRKPTLIAETIQHPLAFRQRRHSGIIVELIQINSRFLTILEVD